MPRHVDSDWNLGCPGKDSRGTCSHDAGNVTNHLLLDLRDRLDVLRCPNFRAIPELLRSLNAEIRGLRRDVRARKRCRRPHSKP